MNSAQAYQLPVFGNVLRHSSTQLRFVRDTIDDQHTFINRELEAQVRSGDYFIALATTLDSLSQSIADYPTRAKIEDIVSDLIYLYDHYEIEKNNE